MPLPEGLTELLFAGMLNRRRFRVARRDGFAIAAEADFVITGRIDPTRTLPEGPFGDHLGYYSLAHDFPVLEVESVYHRDDAVWPFTVVGRPPQEDTTFGKLIHELTEPMVPVSLPGVKALHAVDAAGVHPLLLAIGSERYVPYGEREPREILTCANAILGFGQASLAKYLFIVAREDDPELDVNDIEAFFRHLLSRVDFRRDLHFQTRTTIDTLDYSGTGLNSGSKLVVAAAGRPRRELSSSPRSEPRPRRAPRRPGDEGSRVPRLRAGRGGDGGADRGGSRLRTSAGSPSWSSRTTRSSPRAISRNFLWVTFTRSNPSHDVHGVSSFIEHKHWGCEGPLLIDARLKPHHAPPLIEDPEVTRRVDALASKGRSLHGVL